MMPTQRESAPTAVVLLSGGVDSTTTLAVAISQGFDPCALTFRYGQRHTAETDAAVAIAGAMNVRRHVMLDIDLRQFPGSALTSDIEVPRGRSLQDIGRGIPVTYVPARNTIFLAYALAVAESVNSFDIFIGVNALDYSGYPDCRPEYIAAFQRMAALATRAGVESQRGLHIHTPLIHLTKAEIIRTGLQMGVDYGPTVTCYDPNDRGEACGQCDACRLRLKGFSENGIGDPAPYQPAA